jgi:hypothetical protein
MRKLLLVLALLALAGCGEEAAPTATATATATAAAADGYSQGVKDFYGGDVSHAEEGSAEDVETEYHQPPMPAEAKVGETITLTGINIGVRLRATVTAVKRVDDYQAVELELESTGIANHEAGLTSAAVTYGDGEPQHVVEGASAACSRGFDQPTVFIAVGATARGCLLFPASGSESPDRFQLALEAVPTEAGGIWNLR